MRILIIGGTGFIGSHVTLLLSSWGHEVTVFTRGKSTTDLPQNIEILQGDVDNLTASRETLVAIKPDVVVDMIAYTVDHAKQLLEVFDIPRQRIVLVSSVDVYRAFGRLRRTEPGEPDLIPLLEDDPLREKLFPESMTYDKIGIEKLLRSSAATETFLRLPVVYGPGDKQHRFREYLDQMDGGSTVISLTPMLAEWRCARGYVEDVALAIALSAKNTSAANKVYNVGDSIALTERDFVRAIGRAASWNGEVVVAPSQNSGPEECDFSQHIIVDTTAIRRDLRYEETVPINEAFARTVAWERENRSV